MPIRPRREIQERIGGELTGPMLEDLVTGYCFFDEPFANDQRRRECWEKNRSFILSLQGKLTKREAFGLSNGIYFDFFKRPHAWWGYDAPGRRLFISCKNDFCPFYSRCLVAQSIPTEMPDCIIREGEDRKGKNSFEGLYKIECVGHKFRIYEPIRETEADFLHRHGLLTPTEKKLVEKMPEGWEPGKIGR